MRQFKRLAGSSNSMSDGRRVTGFIRLERRWEEQMASRLDSHFAQKLLHFGEDPGMLTEAFKPDQQLRSTVLMATHDPVMISGMVREQVLLAHPPKTNQPLFSRPVRNPRGQGIANILCSSEFFGLPSSLDKETQKLLDERLAISIKERLTPQDKARLKALNDQLEILPGVSERDPKFVEFLREQQRTNRL